MFPAEIVGRSVDSVVAILDMAFVYSKTLSKRGEGRGDMVDLKGCIRRRQSRLEEDRSMRDLQPSTTHVESIHCQLICNL
jgi:hypothetical protein